MPNRPVLLRKGIVVLALLCSVANARTQKHTACRIDYQDQNHVDYGSAKRVGVVGVITDPDSRPVANACVAIFTEEGHRFVTGRLSDREGRFSLPLLPVGMYRIVVKADPFGVANMKFQKVPETVVDLILHVHMKVRAIDTTSFIDTQ